MYILNVHVFKTKLNVQTAYFAPVNKTYFLLYLNAIEKLQTI